MSEERTNCLEPESRDLSANQSTTVGRETITLEFLGIPVKVPCNDGDKWREVGCPARKQNIALLRLMHPDHNWDMIAVPIYRQRKGETIYNKETGFPDEILWDTYQDGWGPAVTPSRRVWDIFIRMLHSSPKTT